MGNPYPAPAAPGPPIFFDNGPPVPVYNNQNQVNNNFGAVPPFSSIGINPPGTVPVPLMGMGTMNPQPPLRANDGVFPPGEDWCSRCGSNGHTVQWCETNLNCPSYGPPPYY